MKESYVLGRRSNAESNAFWFAPIFQAYLGRVWTAFSPREGGLTSHFLYWQDWISSNLLTPRFSYLFIAPDVGRETLHLVEYSDFDLSKPVCILENSVLVVQIRSSWPVSIPVPMAQDLAKDMLHVLRPAPPRDIWTSPENYHGILKMKVGKTNLLFKKVSSRSMTYDDISFLGRPVYQVSEFHDVMRQSLSFRICSTPPKFNMMAGRLLSYWYGIFSGAVLNFQGVIFWVAVFTFIACIPLVAQPDWWQLHGW